MITTSSNEYNGAVVKDSSSIDDPKIHHFPKHECKKITSSIFLSNQRQICFITSCISCDRVSESVQSPFATWSELIPPLFLGSTADGVPVKRDSMSPPKTSSQIFPKLLHCHNLNR